MYKILFPRLSCQMTHSVHLTSFPCPTPGIRRQKYKPQSHRISKYYYHVRSTGLLTLQHSTIPRTSPSAIHARITCSEHRVKSSRSNQNSKRNYCRNTTTPASAIRRRCTPSPRLRWASTSHIPRLGGSARAVGRLEKKKIKKMISDLGPNWPESFAKWDHHVPWLILGFVV